MSRLLFFYRIKQFLLFFPFPVFLVMGFYSLIADINICGSYSNEMSIMWFLMSIAHCRPWVEYYEIKRCPNGCGCK
jgi:hypothetical protein